MIEEFDEIKSLISKSYEVEIYDEVSKKRLIMDVAERVEFFMENNMELFFNHLYRMDVNEQKVHNILYLSDTEDSVYVALAKLIVERQFQRLETKRKFKQDDWIDI